MPSRKMVEQIKLIQDYAKENNTHNVRFNFLDKNNCYKFGRWTDGRIEIFGMGSYSETTFSENFTRLKWKNFSIIETPKTNIKMKQSEFNMRLERTFLDTKEILHVVAKSLKPLALEASNKIFDTIKDLKNALPIGPLQITQTEGSATQQAIAVRKAEAVAKELDELSKQTVETDTEVEITITDIMKEQMLAAKASLEEIVEKSKPEEEEEETKEETAGGTEGGTEGSGAGAADGAGTGEPAKTE